MSINRLIEHALNKDSESFKKEFGNIMSEKISESREIKVGDNKQLLDENKKYFVRVTNLADKIKTQLETLQDMLMVAGDSLDSDRTEQRRLASMEKEIGNAHSKVDDVYTWARKK